VIAYRYTGPEMSRVTGHLSDVKFGSGRVGSEFVTLCELGPK